MGGKLWHKTTFLFQDTMYYLYSPGYPEKRSVIQPQKALQIFLIFSGPENDLPIHTGAHIRHYPSCCGADAWFDVQVDSHRQFMFSHVPVNGKFQGSSACLKTVIAVDHIKRVSNYKYSVKYSLKMT